MACLAPMSASETVSDELGRIRKEAVMVSFMLFLHFCGVTEGSRSQCTGVQVSILIGYFPYRNVDAHCYTSLLGNSDATVDVCSFNVSVCKTVQCLY